ncbi:50S ribosomal protein L25/general stress protein Ctc [Raineyella sp. LH-20]|uniref:50S ribosomal protein L25/general stress protein Ctc n=1 Tax=Raineyella sp. LH-20 TaxID=3081204 RepID=UPI0029555A67|nr:50S ribosomal protein L25/general stress protein Ctc [Raineyella sp. LH-20]WOP17412.1 50S ribosomal protein L25/general stress protein Ctc [Raineyella sp. LH-20]
MADATLSVQVRDEFGKGASRRTRRAHLVPAVLYGHGMDPLHLTLPGHEAMLALRTDNALLELNVAGETTPRLALVKQIQRDPIRGDLIHVDLLAVRANEKVVVEVAVLVTGESAPATTVVLDRNTISLEAPVTHIPEDIEISVEGLEAGAQVAAKDLALPEGVAFVGDLEEILVTVSHEEVEAAEETAEAAEETPAAE